MSLTGTIRCICVVYACMYHCVIERLHQLRTWMCGSLTALHPPQGLISLNHVYIYIYFECI